MTSETDENFIPHTSLGALLAFTTAAVNGVAGPIAVHSLFVDVTTAETGEHLDIIDDDTVDVPVRLKVPLGATGIIPVPLDKVIVFNEGFRIKPSAAAAVGVVYYGYIPL